MTTSGTYAFAPSFAELAMQAFRRLGLTRQSLTADHFLTAQNEANLMFADWANKGPNLWTVDTQSITLVQGVATYAVDAATIMILDARLSTTTDRVLLQISRSDYNSYPNKTQQAPPTTFWFDRLIAMSVTFWPVPDNGTYTFNFYRFRQSQDAVIAGGVNLELPYRWLDAMCWGLAARLAYPFATEKASIFEQRAMMAYATAAEQDVEYSPIKIEMDFSSYTP